MHWREPIECRPWSWRDVSAGVAIAVFFIALMLAYPMVTAAVEHQADCARGAVHTFIHCEVN